MENRDTEYLKKSVYCRDLNKYFNSVNEAAQYIIDNNLTKSRKLDSVRTYISRALTKGVKAYGMEWLYGNDVEIEPN